jgi:hypothetical protein
MAEKKVLSEAEWDIFADLAERATPSVDARAAEGKHLFPARAFHALAKLMPTVPIELAILRDESRLYGGVQVFMIHRKDHEFEGYHMPGSVILRGQTRGAKLAELIEKEVTTSGLSVSAPTLVQPVESMEGVDDQSEDTLGSNPRGQAEALLYACWAADGVSPQVGQFFPLSALPPNTLGHHRHMAKIIQQWLSL